MSETHIPTIFNIEDWERFAEHLAAFGALLAGWLDEYVERIMTLLAPIATAPHDEYMALGAPYGDTGEGLLRWINEAVEAQRLRSRAEAIEQRWRDQADLREWGRRMRERRAKEFTLRAHPMSQESNADSGHG